MTPLTVRSEMSFCPYRFYPQHYRPCLPNAQVCISPVPTIKLSLCTCRGTSFCPNIFDPQQLIFLLLHSEILQVCYPPEDSADCLILILSSGVMLLVA